MSSRKGDRWERNYRNALTASTEADVDDAERFGLGLQDVALWYAIRLPSSGSGTTDDLPDLHLWHTPNGGSDVAQFAAESKAFAERTRLSNEEVAALRRYADKTGATPIIIAHGDYVGDAVFAVDDLHSTKKGYTIAKHRDFDGAVPFRDFVRSPHTTV